MQSHRSKRLGRALPACIPVLIVLASAASAAAQGSSPEDIAAARALGTEGTRLADTGDCNGAIAKLEAAEKLYHAPTTLDRLGECQIAVGRLVAGTENLNRVVRESLPASAPPVFVAAQKRAQKALAAALPRIGNLKIHVDGITADKVTVTVDGVAVPQALLDADRPTDPGSHDVTASAAGYKTVTASVAVGEGAESAVSLKLDVDPNAVAAAPSPASTASPAAVPPTVAAVPPPSSAHGGERTAAIASFVVGGVGLAVGTVFGILALGTKSTLDSNCVNKVCAPSQQSDIDSLSTKATVSTIGFGFGIAGVAVGAVLFAVSAHSHGEATAKVAPVKPHVEPWIGVGSAGVGGTFQ
jgi:hypothetical protein